MRETRPSRRKEGGFALPLALCALTVIALLMTSALVNAAAERAIGRAHQEGTRSLYAAEGALQRFVAERVEGSGGAARFASGVYAVVLPSGETYRIGVSELHRGATEALPGGEARRRETYSLVAEPQDEAGRGVGALVEVVRTAAAGEVLDAADQVVEAPTFGWFEIVR